MTDRIHLVELHQLAKEQGALFPRRRALFERVSNSAGRTFDGIVGPRGVGKTVLLQQLAANVETAFYVSLDTLEEGDLFELARGLQRDYSVETLLLDEIHFCRDYPAALKKIFDFLAMKVVFTSSVSLSLFESAHDLSRRVRLLPLLPFSFREYLEFAEERSIPVLTWRDIAERRWTNDHLFALSSFGRYLRGGVMPFSLSQPEVLPLLGSILETILNRDIPSVARLMLDEIAAIKKVVKFVGKSEVDGINYSSIARNVGITKYKADQYVDLLEKAFVLKQVFPRGTNVLREPKILMSVPYRLLYRGEDQAIGGLREDFFTDMMRASGHRFEYLKTKRGAKTPDYLVGIDDAEWVIEVGGSGKGHSQFKGISTDKKLILAHADNADGMRRPLHLVGFLT